MSDEEANMVTAETLPAKVYRSPSWDPGTYVVVAVGDSPQYRPLRPIRIRRYSATDWRVECDGQVRPMRWHSLREARYDASALDAENRAALSKETP